MKLPVQDDNPYVGELTVEVDQLVGCYFWWDNADRAKRRIYHGQITAKLEGGYYMLRFSNSDQLPRGLYEVVHIERMATEAWSIFDDELLLGDALKAGNA